MNDDRERENRLIELETQYAHQSVLIEELNQEVTECNNRILRLEKEIQALGNLVRKLVSGNPLEGGNANVDEMG